MFTPHHTPKLMTVQTSTQPNSSILSINLTTYINAYYRDDKIEYNKVRMQWHDELNPMNGVMQWGDLLRKATKNLSFAQKKQFELSSISDTMQDSWIEIVKNSMDTSILNSTDREELIVTLTLKVNYNAETKKLSATITDNGTGFTSKFISELETPEKQSNYINQATSETSRAKRSVIDKPQLFGGAGRGIPILLANFLNGEALENRFKRVKIAKRPPSSIEFYNDATTGGAVIKLTTSPAAKHNLECSLQAPEINPVVHTSNNLSISCTNQTLPKLSIDIPDLSPPTVTAQFSPCIVKKQILAEKKVLPRIADIPALSSKFKLFKQRVNAVQKLEMIDENLPLNNHR